MTPFRPGEEALPEGPPLPRCRHGGAFRLGVTSFVYPAEMLPNVRRVAPYADDVELLFFSSAPTDWPSPEAIDALAETAGKHDLTYTVHLPADATLLDTHDDARERTLGALAAVLERIRPLEPHSLVLHLDGVEPERSEEAARVRELAPAVLARVGAMAPNPSRLAVENLAYPLDWIAPAVRASGAAFCLDVGHALQREEDPCRLLDTYLPEARVVHLCGVGPDGRRHVGADRLPAGLLDALAERLRFFTGVVTLEVFSYEDTAASMRALEAALPPGE